MTARGLRRVFRSVPGGLPVKRRGRVEPFGVYPLKTHTRMQPIRNTAAQAGRTAQSLRTELIQARGILSLADVAEVLRAALAPEEVAALRRWLASEPDDAR